MLVARKRKRGSHAVKVNKTEANSGLRSQNRTKRNRALSPSNCFFYSKADPFVEDTRNNDVSRGSAICADRNSEVPGGSKAKATHVTSKGMKPKFMMKGKKSVAQSGLRVTRQGSSPGWKIIKSKESETTK